MRLLTPVLAAACSLGAEPAPVPLPAWAYELDLDLSGRSGSASGSGLNLGAKAAWVSDISKIELAARLNRLTSGGQTSADDLHLTASSERKLTTEVFWYARGDVGYDNARDLDFLSVAALGYGRRLHEDARGSLSIKLGLGHRQEESALAGPDVSSLAGDLGLDFDRDLGWSRLRIALSLVPALEDLGDVYARNEASLEFFGKEGPLSLRVGLLQDYRSRSSGALSRLESAYYLRVVYKWK